MLVIIFWHFLIVFLRSQSPQVKRYLTSSIANSVHELPHELSNNLRVRILGNQEILAKYQMWGETQPSAQSSFQKQNLDNSSQKICKNRFYFFEVLSNFTVFLQFVRNILASIVWGNIFFGWNLAQFPSHMNYSIFSLTSKHFSNHDVNINQSSSVKSSKFNGFVLALFCILSLGQNLTLENFPLG